MTLPRSASLFVDGPDQNRSLVEVMAHSKPASKAQQRFARLIAKIELKREQLKQWQAYVLRYNQRVLGELEPLREQLRHYQRSMLILVHELLTRSAPGQTLGRIQRTKLHQILMGLLGALSQENDDEVISAMRARYRDTSDQERRCQMDLTRSVLRDVFDLDVGEHHDASSAEELLAHAEREMQERFEQQAQRAQDQRDPRSARGPKVSAANAARAQAAQLKRDQAAKEVGQSLREVYRKLASALHPDREPEPQARARKTEFMQRVNQAYEANDLLTLLGLQLEIEQIDAAHLSSVPPQRLAHYNQLLSEQLASIDAELERCTEPFRRSLGVDWGRPLSVAGVDQDLSVHIAQLRNVLGALREDLSAFRDPRRLRESLRHYRLEQDFDEFDELADLMEVLQTRPPRRRSRR
jgi:hypothetical protein